MSNHRARAQRFAITTSSSEIARQQVEDARAASPSERMQALVALLDATYELMAMGGSGRDHGLCRFPHVTEQRRRGLCSDRRDGGSGARPAEDLPDLHRLELLKKTPGE